MIKSPHIKIIYNLYHMTAKSSQFLIPEALHNKSRTLILSPGETILFPLLKKRKIILNF
jgi:hypothetical protein